MLHQPRITVGSVLESAIWLTGEETEELQARFKADVQRSMEEANERRGVVTGPIRWTEKLPGEERVPPVPDHISGLCVRLLVAEAEVLNVRETESRFLAELEPSDLKRLRGITRQAHKSWWLKTYPQHRWPRPSDRQCDTLINDLGPEAALEALQKGWARLAGDKETVH